MSDVIVSADTLRPDRLPPGQRPVATLPVRHVGPVPAFEPARWDLTVFPVPFVAKVARWTWPQFRTLPRVRVLADFHCESGGSRFDGLWEGVAAGEILRLAPPTAAVTHVMLHGDHGYSANVSLADFSREDVILADTLDGRPLDPEQGCPVRLVLPALFARKSVKWLRGIEYLEADRPGFHDDRTEPRQPDPWA